MRKSTHSNQRGISVIVAVAAGLLFLSSGVAFAQTNSMNHEDMNHDSMDMGNMEMDGENDESMDMDDMEMSSEHDAMSHASMNKDSVTQDDTHHGDTNHGSMDMGGMKMDGKNHESMDMKDMKMPQEHASMNHDSMPLQQSGESTVSNPVHVHAQAEECDPPTKNDPNSGAPACWPDPIMDQMLFGKVLVDQLELGFGDNANTYAWEADAWYGSDYNKVWFKTESEGLQDGGGEAAELQALYSHLISPFFDVQAGLRYDIEPGPRSGRSFAVLGVQGLAPYWFETDTALFISEDGDVSFRGEFEYELLFTQRLILTPKFEFAIAAQDVPAYGIGSGLTSTELGLRLRYEIEREFAPYIGVSYEQTYGDTKEFALTAGEETSRTVFVAGIRVWF